jgi:hypothetical protein
MSEKPFTTTYYLIDSFVQNKPLKDPLMLLFFSNWPSGHDDLCLIQYKFPGVNLLFFFINTTRIHTHDLMVDMID